MKRRKNRTKKRNDIFSVKNVLLTILYAFNISGLLAACQLCSFFCELNAGGMVDKIASLLNNGIPGMEETYKITVIIFIVCSAAAAAVFLYLQLKLLQSRGEERRKDIRIRYVLGYRKTTVFAHELLSEAVHVLAAASAAVIISALVFMLLGRTKAISDMVESSGIPLFSADVCVMCISVIVALITVDSALRVHSSYTFRDL